MTAVIDLHGRRGDPDYDPDLNPDVVYLGRRQWWGNGRLLDGHPLANHYPVKKYGRELALRMYRRDLMMRPDLEEQLAALRGKTLACWCADHSAGCHALIVAELLDGGTDAS